MKGNGDGDGDEVRHAASIEFDVIQQMMGKGGNNKMNGDEKGSNKSTDRGQGQGQLCSRSWRGAR